MCSLFYPVCQLHHVCSVDAEEDVQDFRQLRLGLDPPQVVVLFLCAERALHRCRPHSGKFLNERDSVDQYVVHLRSELNTLHFLAPHYRSHIRLADAHYPVRNTLPAVLALEVVLLLALHPRDDFQITFLPGCQQTLCVLIGTFRLADLFQYLAQ